MKAINLVPRDARRSFSTVRGANGATMVLFGALATAFVLVLAYVLLVNDVRSKRSELAQVNTQVAATQRQVANLKPYADLEQLRQSLLDRVRTLSDGRYDWPGMLDRIARALPADATLTTFDGSAGTAGATGPTITLAGCTPSHDAVAKVIDRLRSVKGVTGVALQSSNLQAGDAGGDGSNEGCSGKPETFNLTVGLTGVAPAAAAPGTPGAAGTTATPATTSTAPAPAAAPGGAQ